MNKLLKTPITYWGGKQTLVPELLPLIPTHNLYCEPFAGGAALFWSKPASNVEVVNDINGEIGNFYTQIRDGFVELNHHVQNSLHSREAYGDALHVYSRPSMFSAVKRAWAFWVLTNQGWCGKIGSWGYGIAENRSECKNLFKKSQFDAVLSERLQKVQIECNDALKVISSRDRDDSFFYVDPPYFNSNMGHYAGYTEGDYKNLLDLLSQLKGKFLMSSYPSDILQTYVTKNGWRMKSFDMALSASKGNKRKTEVLVANFEI